MNFDFLRQFRQIGTASATNTATTTAKTTPTTMAAITAVGRELLPDPGSLGGSLSMIMTAELQLLTKKPLLERICVNYGINYRVNLISGVGVEMLTWT